MRRFSGGYDAAFGGVMSRFSGGYEAVYGEIFVTHGP